MVQACAVEEHGVIGHQGGMEEEELCYGRCIVVVSSFPYLDSGVHRCNRYLFVVFMHARWKRLLGAPRPT